MQLPQSPSYTVETDVLVLGSGIAGLAAALEARRAGERVLLASQGSLGRPSVSYYAGGQFALHLPTGSDASLEQWFTNSPLTDAAVATAVVQEAEPLVLSLSDYGVVVRPSVEGGYSIGSSTGGRASEQLISAMAQRAAQSGVTVLPGFTAALLLTTDGRCYGAQGFTDDGEWVGIHAKATVVAIGGAGRLFQRAFGMTGDGYALLLAAGARLFNLEFIKFFPLGLPTVRYPPQRPSRSFYDLEGLRAVNARGEDIYAKHLGQSIVETMRGLYPRFVTASWIVAKESRDGPVYLDLTRVPAPIWESLRELGVSGLMRRWSGSPGLWKQILGKRMVLTRWISHSVTGGVGVGSDMSTGIAGLFAGGEVVDGFSDLEAVPLYHIGPLAWALTTGHIAGREAAVAARQMSNQPAPKLAVDWGGIVSRAEGTKAIAPASIIRKVNGIMIEPGGPLRNAASMRRGLEALNSAQAELGYLAINSGHQLSQAVGARSMLLVARAVLMAALLREESRSEHYREDFPVKDDGHWNRPIEVSLTEHGELSVEPLSGELHGSPVRSSRAAARTSAMR